MFSGVNSVNLSYVCRVLFARAPVLGLYFFVYVKPFGRFDGMRDFSPGLRVNP